MSQAVKAAPPGSLDRHLAVFVPGTLVAVLQWRLGAPRKGEVAP